MSLAVAVMAASAAPGLAEDKPLTQRNETVESAVSTPVEDLNIKKTKIPDVLQRAQANPYELGSAPTCDAIATEVSLLNAELGDDKDDVETGVAEADGSKGPSAGALLKAGVAQAIPFRGIVRQISGAAQHEKVVESAIDAGFARRGFLKGRAMEMNCAPPASPAWFSPRPEVSAAQTATSVAVPLVQAPPLAVAEAPTTAVEAPAVAQPVADLQVAPSL